MKVKCYICGLEFEPENSDEEAIEEFRREFPGVPFDPEELGVICDRCNERFIPWLKTQSFDN